MVTIDSAVNKLDKSATDASDSSRLPAGQESSSLENGRDEYLVGCSEGGKTICDDHCTVVVATDFLAKSTVA